MQSGYCACVHVGTTTSGHPLNFLRVFCFGKRCHRNLVNAPKSSSSTSGTATNRRNEELKSPEPQAGGDVFVRVHVCVCVCAFCVCVDPSPLILSTGRRTAEKREKLFFPCLRFVSFELCKVSSLIENFAFWRRQDWFRTGGEKKKTEDTHRDEVRVWNFCCRLGSRLCRWICCRPRRRALRRWRVAFCRRGRWSNSSGTLCL